MKTQILYVHGGMTPKSRKVYLDYLRKRVIYTKPPISWSAEFLDKKLKGFEIIRPRMPLREQARFEDWKIHFERFFPFLKDDIILIGESLGGMFLAKYLSENKFPKKILSLYLVCPPFDNSLPTEDLSGGFKLKSDLSLIEKNSPKVTLLFSKNDDVVPVEHAKKYRNKLKNAKIIVYNHIKGHFRISRFPQIVKMIKDDVKRK